MPQPYSGGGLEDMLRITLLLLVLANMAYYLWSHERLVHWGLGPVAQTEPQRLAQQIRPDALRFFPDPPPVPEAGANTAPSPEEKTGAPAEDDRAVTAQSPLPMEEPTQCLLAADIDAAAGGAALHQSLLAQVPRAQWEMTQTRQSGRWMVYMGPFANATQLERVRTDLRARGVEFARPGAALEPGLSLGRFSSEQAAARYMRNLVAQGVAVSRVVQERPDMVSYTLRLPAATPALRAQVEALAAAVLAQHPLRPC